MLVSVRTACSVGMQNIYVDTHIAHIFVHMRFCKDERSSITYVPTYILYEISFRLIR